MNSKRVVLFAFLISLNFTTGVAEDRTFVSTKGELSVSLKKKTRSQSESLHKLSLSDKREQDLDNWSSMFPNIGYTNDWLSYTVRNYREINYEIAVENTGESVLNGVRIEYCIYHQATISERIDKGRLDAHTRDGSGGWVSTGGSASLPTRKALDTITGKILFKELQQNDEVTAQTDSLKLAEDRKESFEIRINKSSGLRERHERTIDGKLLGIRCRVYVPTPSGSYTTFEFVEPEDLLTELGRIAPDRVKKKKGGSQ